jgi:hypothetical protein
LRFGTCPQSPKQTLSNVFEKVALLPKMMRVRENVDVIFYLAGGFAKNERHCE